MSDSTRASPPRGGPSRGGPGRGGDGGPRRDDPARALIAGLALLLLVAILLFAVVSLVPTGTGSTPTRASGSRTTVPSSPASTPTPPTAAVAGGPAPPPSPGSVRIATDACASALAGDAVYQSALRYAVQFITGEAGGVGVGSGFVVAPGWVATNDHVVSGASEIHVRFANGQHTLGTVAWSDSHEDLALVRLAAWPATGFTAAPLASSATVSPGVDVWVLGAPLGLDWSISKGVLSAKRPATPSEVSYLQVDAAVNPGNSGGPLIDRCGRVVGVIRMKVLGNRSGGGPPAEALNFARPLEALEPGLRRVGL